MLDNHHVDFVNLMLIDDLLRTGLMYHYYYSHSFYLCDHTNCMVHYFHRLDRFEHHRLFAEEES